ncbi:hypothetical protein [Tenacibaculum maritimum]|uniref:hypothetical protein n=1 Tax=Tenacibaculum maritimum TaxID=107401 RepID=UPI001E2F7950|nr:hypothetical protein [Tenacibaculum maritimum]MCD9612237.1 hypothetical protein [Tenacibaculum maritimum]
MSEIEKMILENDFDSLKIFFLKYENTEIELKENLDPLIDDYGLLIIFILLEIAKDRNISFWYDHVSYYLSIGLSHIDGAERLSLLMLKRSLKLDFKKDTIRAILDFKKPPEIILTNKEYDYYLKMLNSKGTSAP